ncbi:hypothetical protein DSBG_3659 [Desulfosporosinus sp. BG]|nr:hypothetical protein DSBG_3659 [Desulfosporosinus sp. BG]
MLSLNPLIPHLVYLVMEQGASSAHTWTTIEWPVIRTETKRHLSKMISPHF